MSSETSLAEVLRAQAPYDESLHSFLLRTQFTYEPTAKPIGVLDKSGLLYLNPFAHKDVEYLFHKYSDQQLLEAADIGQTIDGEDNGLFDSPSYYARKIQWTFFSGRQVQRSDKVKGRVRYCISCINEGIESFGYGYFRHFWDVSNHCLIHNKPLKVLPELSFIKTVKVVKGLLRGQDFEAAISFPKTSRKEVVKNNKPVPWYESGKYVFPIKAASCLMEPFALWLWDNYHQIKDERIHKFSYKVSTDYLLRTDEVREVHSKKELAAVHLLCSSLAPEVLAQFYSEHVDFFGLELGPRKQGKIREIYSKSKNANCDSCRNGFCGYKDEGSTTFDCPSDFDFDYLMSKSYTMARIAMQGRPIGQMGRYVWSALDVNMGYELHL